MKMSVKNSCSKKVAFLFMSFLILTLSISVEPASADIPSYPSLTPGDYHIAYDLGNATGTGYFVSSDGASIRVLYTPSVNGLLHEVRIIWSYLGSYSGYVRLVIEDTDTPTKKTSEPIQVSFSRPASWHVIDVSSLAFVTSGDFYVYIQHESGGVPTSDHYYISVHDDSDTTIDHPGRFQWSEDGSTWVNRREMCIRAVITPPPEQVIPELPFGTVTALLMMAAALVLYQKYH